MLIEFRVGNFRSVLNEQVLSLVASTDRSML
jgi:AAA15 family ATPase/GTPase